MICATGIHKAYGPIDVLRGVDLTVGAGEVVTIVGKSGAGKSTLLHILGTLDRPDRGEVTIAGTRVDSLGERRLAAFRNRHIGLVFQFHQLLPEFTAIENVVMPALIGGTPEAAARARGMELLDLLGLADRARHRPGQLSGGERQRVAVARALMNRPDVILADEPSGSLDTLGKAGLHRLLFDLRAQLGQTFVIVTHDESLAAMSDRTLRMADGLITEPLTPGADCGVASGRTPEGQ